LNLVVSKAAILLQFISGI